MVLDALAAMGDRVTTAIRSASRSTGTTFDYLLRTAIRESSLDPRAAARTSSARGLYQFIESTWLALVKEEGPRFGLARQAAAIERAPDGRYVVRDPKARAQILKLRENPEVAATMAGALAERNAAGLRRALGRDPTAGELYLAHFLGLVGASRLIALKRAQPNAPASLAAPDAARANPAIFYDGKGAPRTVAEVHAALIAQHGNRPARSAPASLEVAALRPTLPGAPEPARPAPPVPVARVSFEHPVNPGLSAFAAKDGSAFHTMFSSDPPSGALSPAVRELWGGAAPNTDRRAAPERARGALGAVSGPLDLAGFLRPSVSPGGRRTRLGG